MDFRDINEFLKDTMGYIITFVIVLLLFIYVIALHQVIGPSMNDTLTEGDVLILDKISYRFRNPKRNEIVVISVDSKTLIKRVIGLPGETIQYKGNILYIDGTAYKEDNITEVTANFGPITLGSDEYFVMGDNRINSLDSRDVGAISKSSM